MAYIYILLTLKNLENRAMPASSQLQEKYYNHTLTMLKRYSQNIPEEKNLEMDSYAEQYQTMQNMH